MGVRLQERQGLRESDDVEGRRIIVSHVRTRHRVEPCLVHNQGKCRAEAGPHLVGSGLAPRPTRSVCDDRFDLRFCADDHFQNDEGKVTFSETTIVAW